jgi:uncharacterized protein (DUF362 family)
MDRSAQRPGRRAFLLGSAGVTLLGCDPAPRRAAPAAPAPAPAAPGEAADTGPFALPGPFRGRVIEVFHPGAIRDGQVDQAVVSAMLRGGMSELTGEKDAAACWRRLFEPGDVVGIKVNPVARRNDKHPERTPVVTSPQALRAVIEGLLSAGVRPADIVVFDRYRDQLLACGYHRALPAGVRWDAAAIEFEEDQRDLDGYAAPFLHAREDGSPKVSGYDPAVYKELDLVDPRRDPADPRSRRSHLCVIVSQKINKLVNLCVLKDHASAGVTGALKNLSHGLFNNVFRSHVNPGLTHCHSFIPAMVSLPMLRRKVVLHVMEALWGIYQGGPGLSNPVQTWAYRSLLLATDPVAMDRIAWGILDQKRVLSGLPPLARSGVMGQELKVPGDDGGQVGEAADYRQVQHIELAGALGLGVFARDQADLVRWLGPRPKASGRPLQTIRHRRLRLG